jgi:putative hydrolase of the HAD superfamily
MIKNIIFDMGNVLTIYRAKEHIMKYVNNDDDYRIILEQVCASVEWIQMDRGTITDEEAITSICKRVPLHLHSTVSIFIKEFRIDQPENPHMEELVIKMKEAGYQLYLFSNTAHRFHIFSKNIKSIQYMDGIWISCEHGFLKPETEAYSSFFEKFHLLPEECYFIDDSPANIEASLRREMRGCVYHQNIQELKNELQLAGIQIQ